MRVFSSIEIQRLRVKLSHVLCVICFFFYSHSFEFIYFLVIKILYIDICYYVIECDQNCGKGLMWKKCVTELNFHIFKVNLGKSLTFVEIEM